MVHYQLTIYCTTHFEFEDDHSTSCWNISYCQQHSFFSGGSRPSDKRGAPVSKKFFFGPSASFWSKNGGVGWVPGPPLDPPLYLEVLWPIDHFNPHSIVTKQLYSSLMKIRIIKISVETGHIFCSNSVLECRVKVSSLCNLGYWSLFCGLLQG